VRTTQSIIRVGDYLWTVQSEHTPTQAGKARDNEALHSQAKQHVLFVLPQECPTTGTDPGTVCIVGKGR